jgi:hypothetical protein
MRKCVIIWLLGDNSSNAILPRNKSRELPVGEGVGGTGRDQPCKQKLNYTTKKCTQHQTGFDLGTVGSEDSSVSSGSFELCGCYTSVHHKANGFKFHVENTKFISITDILIIIHCSLANRCELHSLALELLRHCC